MHYLLRLSVFIGLLCITTIVGAQVIYDAKLNEELLINLTADQNAVAYTLDLSQPETIEVDITYLGEVFPLQLDVLLTNGTPITSQPINGAGTYVLDLNAGNYYLLFVGSNGATGRLVAQLATASADDGAVVAQNPTSSVTQPGSGPVQPGASAGTGDGASSGATQPVADQDGDGVPDAEDVCSATPGNPANAGCPLPSEPSGASDPMPVPPTPITASTEPGNDLSLTPLEMTPAPTSEGGFMPSRPSEVDRDNDGIPDNVDACPDEAGVATSIGAPTHGCPQGASSGILPEPGEYEFVSTREGCENGRRSNIAPENAYTTFVFITHGGSGNSIIMNWEGKEEVIFTRDAENPRVFRNESQLIGSVPNSRRVEMIIFGTEVTQYSDLHIDPRDTSCNPQTTYDVTRVSDATTREERAQNNQTDGNEANMNAGGGTANDALAGSYQADLAQSGRGCEDSEVVFPDSGVSVQLSVAVAPNGTDLIVTSSNGQSVTFLPDGANTYAADDGSLRLVITVENGTITRYAEYQLSGGSCDVTRIYEMQQTATPEDEEEPAAGGGGDGPTYEINGQPIQEGDWQGPMSLLGVGCPGAEDWNATSANARGEFITATLTFTPQGIEYREPAFSSFLLLVPTGVDNQFRAEVTGFIYQIDFDTINSGTLSRYAFMGGTCSSGEAAQFALTHVGN